MGFRFSLEHANWLAHILQPSGPAPTLANEFEAREALGKLLEAARHDFYANRRDRFEFLQAIDEAKQALAHQREETDALQPLRAFFRDVPWVALLIPSGESEFDRFLSSRDLLEELVHIRPGDRGLILQLDEGPRDRRLELDNVFPAFRVALANATRWPGVLVWTRSGDAAFYDTPASRHEAREALRWLFSHLAVSLGTPDLALLREQYERECVGGKDSDVRPLRILHLSDIHLGSRVAQRRLPRVKQLVQMIAAELGEHAPLVPVVSGDLMDTPDDAHLDAARDFIEFLCSVGSEEPVVVLGNHDVRKDGWLSQDLQNALCIQTNRTRWFDQSCTGLACFNSVRSGRLARGHMDETELMDVGVSLDRDREKAESFVIAGVLHHHPIPVERPPWYRQDWFERFLGRAFEKTDALENSEQFLDWLRIRRVGLVLHGHKHIPRVDMHKELMVVGCGSTVGKVQTQEEGTTYMSMNVVTIDVARGLVSCRLRAERIPGGGFVAEEQHEAVLTTPVFRGVAGSPRRNDGKKTGPGES